MSSRHRPKTEVLSADAMTSAPPLHDLGGDYRITNNGLRAKLVPSALRRLTTGRAQRPDPDSHIVPAVVVSCD